MFRKVSTTIQPEAELEILEFWKKNDIFKKSMYLREEQVLAGKATRWVFLEGPPTANGMPHPGHVLTKAMKDIIPRYKTMRGHAVWRKAGWDTHGLPVEIEVERELGIDGKAAIERYGVENFIKKCRQSVFKYEAEWRKMVERGGFWIDQDDPYITCSNEYIESVWWILKRFWEAGLLYEGHKVIPYCPRCGTGVSSHEVAQGYEEVEDPSIYVRFQILDEKGNPVKNTFFLVWTTTPWTLISNVALAVKRDIDYVKVKVPAHASWKKQKKENSCSQVKTSDCEYLILAKALLEKAVRGDYEIVEEMRGEALLGTRYEQLFKFIKPDRKGHYVIHGDFVTTDDGTGIVHIAPAFGEDDYNAGKIYDLPFIQAVDLQGKFIEEVTLWKGQFVKDADPSIIEYMRTHTHDEATRDSEKDNRSGAKDSGSSAPDDDAPPILYHATRCVHTYPFCWRCSSPLLYYARHSWFIRTTAIKDRIIAANEEIAWYPEHVKTGRFRNFLENMVDWALSRDRYWGTPLPIWKCQCGHTECIGSIEELRTKGRNVPDDIELHKPYVDHVELVCPKCSSGMKRTAEVIDCWFDSGSMHTAQWHYPFENKEKFERNFPGWICEAIDQTRGWFYSLLVTSVFLYGRSCYNEVVVLGHILDKDGIKMSKSKGNIVDPFEAYNRYGADALRWSLYSATAPWNARRFSFEGIAEAQSKFLGTIQNVYSFFVLYANIDKFNPLEHEIPLEKRSLIDRWIASRMANLIKNVCNALDKYEILQATRHLENFVDDLSNWYVRRSRRRFWRMELDHEKVSAYLTLYEMLVDLAKLIAPFTPFIAEQIYQNIVAGIASSSEGKLTVPESVHLCDYPTERPHLIDAALEEDMEFARKVVYLGRAARNEVQIKVRQPLSALYVKVRGERDKKVLEKLGELIKEELNVKEIYPREKLDEFMDYKVKPNFKVLGASYKSLMPRIKAHIESTPGKEIVLPVLEGRKYEFEIDGQKVVLDSNSIEYNAVPLENFVMQSENEFSVVLDTRLNEDLKLEGIAREIVNKIQNMRKEANFDIIDQIGIGYEVVLPENKVKIEEAIKRHSEYIMGETLAKEICQAELKKKRSEAISGAPATGDELKKEGKKSVCFSANSEYFTMEWDINGIGMLLGVKKM